MLAFRGFTQKKKNFIDIFVNSSPTIIITFYIPNTKIYLLLFILPKRKKNYMNVLFIKSILKHSIDSEIF